MLGKHRACQSLAAALDPDSREGQQLQGVAFRGADAHMGSISCRQQAQEAAFCTSNAVFIPPDLETRSSHVMVSV